MALRVPCLAVLLPCLSACALTLKPEDSTYVSLSQALQILATELNRATPVVLNDIDKDSGQMLQTAIKGYQCADKTADPPLFVLTGPVSLQLQGSIQKQVQGGGQAGLPAAAQFSFQVQKTKAQQQQLTIPITFVAASALPNFFLGQNLTNVSTLPDLPDPKSPDTKPDSKADAKAPAGKGKGNGDGSSPSCANTSCDKVTLGQDKATLQLSLVDKANVVRTAVTQQINKWPSIQSGCPKDQNLNVLPAISIILPPALNAL